MNEKKKDIYDKYGAQGLEDYEMTGYVNIDKGVDDYLQSVMKKGIFKAGKEIVQDYREFSDSMDAEDREMER